MSNTFKRRIYRISVASASSFLAAFLLYDLGDVGIATNQLFLPCYILLFVGILFAFKALDIWSSWNEDNSEYTNIGHYESMTYPITFYTEAALMALSGVFLLVFTIIRSWPTIEEESVLAIALVVAGGCTCMARLSRGLE